MRDTLAIDPYIFTRNAYLQYRESAIHQGKPPVDQSLYDEEPDSPPASRPAPPQAVARLVR